MRTYAQEWKLFEYIRNRYELNKPYATDSKGWKDWKAQAKAAKPVVYFLCETVPDFINDIAHYIPTPISNIRYYCRNRFYRKTHVLPTGFTPGEYHELDERILYGIMNSLVDYVEVELAYKSRWCRTEESKTAKWKNGRCPELGLAHLAWEMTLDDPALDISERSDTQASTAREVKEIYDWWKARPNRLDPYDASGWTVICEEARVAGLDFLEHGDDDYESRKSECFKLLRKIEDAYEAEDQDMLIRVIKRRRSFWT